MTTQVPSLRQLRLICFAILAGPALFAAVIPVILSESETRGLGTELPEMLDTIAAIASTTVIPLAFFVRRTVWSKAAGAGEQQRILSFAQGSILFLALLEGAMLLDLVVWLLVGKPVPAAIVAGILWLIALVNFPRQQQLDDIG